MIGLLRKLRRPASTALALLAAALSTVPSARAAASGEQVELSVFECEPAFEEELRRIVRLELGGLLYEGPARGTGDLGRVQIRCQPDVAHISVADARRAQQADHVLRYDAFPGDAAPRAVALAAVEALRAVDPALAARIEAQRSAASPKPQPPPPPQATRAEPRRPRTAAPARQAPRSWTRVLLGPVVRHFVSESDTTVWGARAELGRHASEPLDFGFDLEAALAEHEVELGAIDVRVFSAAAWLGWRAGRADWSFTGGAGWRFGIANLAGSSVDPSVRAAQTSRVWTGPLALARGDAAFGSFALALVAEAGWAVAGAEGLSEGTSVVGVRGPWLALSLNPGIRF